MERKSASAKRFRPGARQRKRKSQKVSCPALQTKDLWRFISMDKWYLAFGHVNVNYSTLLALQGTHLRSKQDNISNVTYILHLMYVHMCYNLCTPHSPLRLPSLPPGPQ
jgi:hypothetical protein